MMEKLNLELTADQKLKLEDMIHVATTICEASVLTGEEEITELLDLLREFAGRQEAKFLARVRAEFANDQKGTT